MKSYTKYFNSKEKENEPKINIPVNFESQSTKNQTQLDLLSYIQQAILSEIELIEKKCIKSEKAKYERTDLLNEIIKYMMEDDNVQENLLKAVLDNSLNVLKKM